MLQQAESLKVTRQILDKFTEWADQRIKDYSEAIPYISNDLRIKRLGKVEALQSAKVNLMRIIMEVKGDIERRVKC